MAKENVGQVYYIEQWRNPNIKKHFGFMNLKNAEELRKSIITTKMCGLVTVAYFRIKLKDK